MHKPVSWEFRLWPWSKSMVLGQPTWIDMAIWVCLNNRIPGVTTRKYDGWPMLIGWSVDHFPYSNGHMEYPSASISFIFRLTRTLHTFHGAKTRPGKALEHQIQNDSLAQVFRLEISTIKHSYWAVRIKLSTKVWFFSLLAVGKIMKI